MAKTILSSLIRCAQREAGDVGGNGSLSQGVYVCRCARAMLWCRRVRLIGVRVSNCDAGVVCDYGLSSQVCLRFYADVFRRWCNRSRLRPSVSALEVLGEDL